MRIKNSGKTAFCSFDKIGQSMASFASRFTSLLASLKKSAAAKGKGGDKLNESEVKVKNIRSHYRQHFPRKSEIFI